VENPRFRSPPTRTESLARLMSLRNLGRTLRKAKAGGRQRADFPELPGGARWTTRPNCTHHLTFELFRVLGTIRRGCSSAASREARTPDGVLRAVAGGGPVLSRRRSPAPRHGVTAAPMLGPSPICVGIGVGSATRATEGLERRPAANTQAFCPAAVRIGPRSRPSFARRDVILYFRLTDGGRATRAHGSRRGGGGRKATPPPPPRHLRGRGTRGLPDRPGKSPRPPPSAAAPTPSPPSSFDPAAPARRDAASSLPQVAPDSTPAATLPWSDATPPPGAPSATPRRSS